MKNQNQVEDKLANEKPKPIVKKKTKPTTKRRNTKVGDTTFFKVLRNQYIRNEISKHVKKFNDIRSKHSKHTVKSLLEYNERSYMTKVTLAGDGVTNNNQQTVPIALPSNLLPSSVDTLEINSRGCNICEHDLPKRLKFISFGGKFTHPLNFNYIPTTIIKISFSNFTNIIMPEVLNDYNNLQFITLGESTQHLIPHLNRFKRLKSLCIDGTDGNDFIIPDGITTLIIGSNYKSMLPSTYPLSLTSIRINHHFTKAINLNAFPLHLKLIIICSFHTLCRFTFNQFLKFKELESLQYYCGKSCKDIEGIEGIEISETFPNLKTLLVNNKEYKSENGKLTFNEFVKSGKSQIAKTPPSTTTNNNNAIPPTTQ